MTAARRTAVPKPPLPLPLEIVARLAAAGLVATMAYIHLHLWNNGYQHIHVIGVLFLLNGIGAIVLALALLASPRRLLGGVALLSALFTAGTMLGLVISLTRGVFGYKEFSGAPFVTETFWVESIGIVVSAALAAGYLKLTWSAIPRRHGAAVDEEPRGDGRAEGRATPGPAEGQGRPDGSARRVSQG